MAFRWFGQVSKMIFQFPEQGVRYFQVVPFQSPCAAEKRQELFLHFIILEF
jgi:hypothetical protein